MKFSWHPPKAARNLRNHGVSFEEACTIFVDPLADIQPDIRHSIEEARFIALGTSAQGRLLVVVFTEPADTIHIISTREAEPKERRHYEAYDPFA